MFVYKGRNHVKQQRDESRPMHHCLQRMNSRAKHGFLCNNREKTTVLFFFLAMTMLFYVYKSNKSHVYMEKSERTSLGSPVISKYMMPLAETLMKSQVKIPRQAGGVQFAAVEDREVEQDIPVPDNVMEKFNQKENMLPNNNFKLGKDGKVGQMEVIERNEIPKIQNILPIAAFIRDNMHRQIPYAVFKLSEPRFAHESDKALFFMSMNNIDILKEPAEEFQRGKVEVLQPGYAHMGYECSKDSSMEHFQREPQNMLRHSPDIEYLVPVLVDNSCRISTFVNVTLYKILQAYEYIKHDEVYLLLKGPCDLIIIDFLHDIGIPQYRILMHREGYYYPSKFQINSCVSPNVHPAHLKRLRQLLQIDNLPVDRKNGDVILLYSGLLEGNKVKITNMNSTKNILRSFYGDRLKIYNGEFISLDQVRAIFKDAYIVMGIHSSAMYYSMFAPSKANIVELMPARKNGTTLPIGYDTTITWRISSAIGQTYWRSYQIKSSPIGQLAVSTGKLKAIIGAIEGKPIKHRRNISDDIHQPLFKMDFEA